VCTYGVVRLICLSGAHGGCFLAGAGHLAVTRGRRAGRGPGAFVAADAPGHLCIIDRDASPIDGSIQDLLRGGVAIKSSSSVSNTALTPNNSWKTVRNQRTTSASHG
jgi:hypothetical protein